MTGQYGTKIFVACTPKSGSSFVVTFLQNVTGFGHHNPTCPGDVMLEADPYLPELESVALPTVSQLHCYAKPKTIVACERFSIRPIFLTRNIFDSILSWKEYIDARPEHCEVFPHYYEMHTEEQKRAFLIDVYAPIFIRIVASWQAAFITQRVPVLWLTYEEFFRDPLAGVRKMFAHLGIEKTDAEITAALDLTRGDTKTTKFNVGASHRGVCAFTAAERFRILNLVKTFKGFDPMAAGILGDSVRETVEMLSQGAKLISPDGVHGGKWFIERGDKSPIETIDPAVVIELVVTNLVKVTPDGGTGYVAALNP